MKYVRCDSHCKFPAYDKEEVDNLLKDKINNEEVIKKNDIAVIDIEVTFRTSASNGVYYAPILVGMPEGFTSENSIIVSRMFGTTNSLSSETENERIEVALLTSDTYSTINGTLSTTDSEEAGQTYLVRIVLMKLN